MTPAQQEHIENMQAIAATNAMVNVDGVVGASSLAIGKVVLAYASKLEELIANCETIEEVRALLKTEPQDDSDWWKQ